MFQLVHYCKCYCRKIKADMFDKVFGVTVYHRQYKLVTLAYTRKQFYHQGEYKAPLKHKIDR